MLFGHYEQVVVKNIMDKDYLSQKRGKVNLIIFGQLCRQISKYLTFS